LCTGSLCVPGDHWPVLLYLDLEYDPNDPWSGFMMARILVYAYKCIFTSPRSVETHGGATSSRNGNTAIYGMTRVTMASLCYVTTQVRFCLSSASVFSQNDKITDSEHFYNSLLNYLDNPVEQKQVSKLMKWWDRYVL
ncbi:hypothetical protein OF83DRAFT_1040655, partial [Amylostereum chailletii]